MKHQVHKFWDTLFPDPNRVRVESGIEEILNAKTRDELMVGFYSDGTADKIDLEAVLKEDTPFSRMIKMLFKAVIEEPDDSIGIKFTTGDNPEFKGYMK